MGKRLVSHFLFPLLIAFVLISLPHSTLNASQIQVEAQGSAALEYSKQQARQDAIHDAQRNAVADALGIMLSSETVVENFVLIKDKILTQVEGYVRDYSILEESCSATECTVRIQATVEEIELADDVAALAGILPRMNYPSVAVALQEQSLTAESSPMPLNLLAASQSIESNLRNKGFDLINQTSGDISGAQLLIRGQAYVQDNGASPYDERFHAYAATIVADICETSTGKVLASSSTNAIFPHHSFAIGSQKALQKAAEQFAENISEQIVSVWLEACYNEHQISLLVTNCSFSEVAEIERALSGVSGIIRAHQKQFGSKGAEFVLGWQSCNTLRLAQNINQLQVGNKKLTITSAGNYALQAALN